MTSEGLRNELTHILSEPETLIVTLGNEIMGDDGIGVWIGNQLATRFGEWVINAHNVPVSYLGKIIEKQPKALLFVDAIKLDEEPGTIAVFDAEIVANTQSTTTHYQETSDLLEFITSELGYSLPATFVCIQIQDTNLLDEISIEVKEAGEKIVTLITEILEDT